MRAPLPAHGPSPIAAPLPPRCRPLAAAHAARRSVFVGGLTGVSIDPEADFLFVSFKLPAAVFRPADGNAAGRATTTVRRLARSPPSLRPPNAGLPLIRALGPQARVDFDYHGAFQTLLGDQSPEQWAREHLVFVVRATGPHRHGAEGQVLGLASVPLVRPLAPAPRRRRRRGV